MFAGILFIISPCILHAGQSDYFTLDASDATLRLVKDSISQGTVFTLLIQVRTNCLFELIVL